MRFFLSPRLSNGLKLFLAVALVWCVSFQATAKELPTAAQLEQTYTGEVRPILAKYCDSCHGAGETIEADLSFVALASWAEASRDASRWQHVKEMVDGGLMPPEDSPQPTPDERAKIERWVDDYLFAEAATKAGDPGPVVLRRLSNAEYTYTLRDLTGVNSLEPAREFPVDGAAGEGFTNTGNALVMSPALVTKYLEAGKAVAEHAVLLPDGIRFSKSTSARDWTDETVSRIREFYARFTEAGGDHLVVQQGVPLDVGMGGQIPLARYFAATLEERDALVGGAKSIEEVAQARGLSPKYLKMLWVALNADERSMLLDSLRAHWRAAKPGDEAALVGEVVAWQKGLFTFAGVGLIGRKGGPKQWLEPISPLSTQQEVRLKLPESNSGDDIVLSLVASDAGDGNAHDYVVWQRPRLVAPGRPDLLIRDLPRVASELQTRRQHMLPRVAAYLMAADEVSLSETMPNLDAVAAKYGVEAEPLKNWLNYLGIGQTTNTQIEGLFTEKLTNVGGHAFINGWGTDATPLVLANASDELVRIPGYMRPHGVCVHPSPTHCAAVGWRSPVTGRLRIETKIAIAHPECTNGVTWNLELRRGGTSQQLAGGVANPQTEGNAIIESVALREGDAIVLLIGALGGHHSCDLTAVDLKLSTIQPASADAADANANESKAWDLGADVSADVLAANPHTDRYGNAGVWHFYAEPERAGVNKAMIPAGSLLAQWQIAASAEERSRLAGETQHLFAAGPPADRNHPNAVLYRELNSFGGPLLSHLDEQLTKSVTDASSESSAEQPGDNAAIGLLGAAFGKFPGEQVIDPDSVCVHAPATIQLRIPAFLADGYEFVTTGRLADEAAGDGSVQIRAVVGDAEANTGLQVSEVAVTQTSVTWSGDNRQVASSSPILVAEKGPGRERVESAFDDFRQLFPAALCYTKIVPVDEVVTLVLFHREDEHLQRLMLDDAQLAELDRLWGELHYVSQDAFQQGDVLEQVLEYATQDADPKVFEPMREPIAQRAAAFRQLLLDTQPKHVDSVVELAGRAYRHPLTESEIADLRKLYDSLRQEELSHEEAIRLMLARVLVSPAFLYRAELPQPGTEPRPVSDWELASRLSYFLWASEPDSQLRELAAAGKLHQPEVLKAQARRMMQDEKVRRLATEFACHWLHIHDFDELDEKSERHFPTFVGLREAMYEESIQFFTHLFNDNASVLDILLADYTYLNGKLAEHYGIPDVEGEEWRRVDGVRQHSRGGVLTQAAALTKQSGASRTSPILRGIWVSEVLLGERLPKPPQGVPPLPDDASESDELTVRQLVEKHVSDPKCAVCHARIDPYGFALENFDAIGRYREKDLGDQPIDSRSQLADGTPIEGFAGLQNYLANTRRDAFVRQFCRKLLGYSLGRAVRLSDEPLLAEMQEQLKQNDYRVAAAVEAIVLSPQFGEIRGRDFVAVDP